MNEEQDLMQENQSVNQPEIEPVQEQSQNDGILSDYEDKKKKKKAKKVLTPEQKKKRTIKALIITGSIVLVLAIFLSSCAIANAVGVKALIKQAESFASVKYTEHAQLVPQKDSDGFYTFVADDQRDFKVLQLTDVHIGGGCFSQSKDAWAMNAVATMVRAEQPDLVVVTGDIAYPVPFQAGTFNNMSATKTFATMMESLQVYWTFAFGNHDTELYSIYSREDICEYYEESNFQYCLFERGFSGKNDGYGNNAIKVKNSQGIITQAIVTLDSHSYTDGDYFGMAWKYDNIHQSQVDWYVQTMDEFTAQNTALGAQDTVVKNLVFFHIPLVEYRDAWTQLMDNSPNATTDKENRVTRNINDTADVKYYYGIVGESDKTKNGIRSYGVYCGYGQDDLFEQGQTHGMQGLFCGHDHYNNFSIEYKGIRLTYGMSIDYLAYPGIYKEHLQRGCTVITIDANGNFDCHANNYYCYELAFDKN